MDGDAFAVFKRLFWNRWVSYLDHKSNKTLGHGINYKSGLVKSSVNLLKIGTAVDLLSGFKLGDRKGTIFPLAIPLLFLYKSRTSETTKTTITLSCDIHGEERHKVTESSPLMPHTIQ